MTIPKLHFIFKKIILIDSTQQNLFQNKKSIQWKIELNHKKLSLNKYSNLIPHLIRNKNIDDALKPFQREGVKWLLEKNDRILADDMGLGKTIQCIAGLQKLIFKNDIYYNIILAPNTLLKNWQLELKKWAPFLTSKILNSDDFNENKISLINSNYNIIIMPYSLLIKLVRYKNFNSLNFDCVIADEAHKLRNNTSSLNKNFCKLNKRRTWLVTGTPLERDIKDIKNILICLNKNKFITSPNIEDFILKSRIESNSLRRIKKDVLKDLPKINSFYKLIDMNEKQKLHYNSLLKDMMNTNYVERIGFLTKLSIAAISDLEGSSNKLDYTIDICNNIQNKKQKVIIFSTFNEPLKELYKRLSMSNIKALHINTEENIEQRNKLLEKFKNTPNITCLLLNSKIGGEGITVTEANNMVFLNEWWNPSSNRQAVDRINRIGQTQDISIYFLRSKNSIDENVCDILDKKMKLEKEFLSDLIKSLI